MKLRIKWLKVQIHFQITFTMGALDLSEQIYKIADNKSQNPIKKMCFQIIFTTVALNLGEQTWASATHRATNSRMIAGHTNPVTRVSDIIGWRLGLINKLIN